MTALDTLPDSIDTVCVIYHGLGDAIYARPFIRAVQQRTKGKVFVRSPHPLVFFDFEGLGFPGYDFARLHRGFAQVPLMYHETLLGDSANVWQAMELAVPLGPHPIGFHATPPRAWIDEAMTRLPTYDGRPIVIVRRPVVRARWPNRARNGLSVYFEQFIRRNRDRYLFVSVSNTDGVSEEFAENMDGIDVKFEQGELSLEILMGLVGSCAGCLCSPSFLLPMSLMFRRPCLLIAGGYANPSHFVDDRMDLTKLIVVAPEPFCECQTYLHECCKRIPESALLIGFESFETLINGNQFHRNAG